MDEKAATTLVTQLSGQLSSSGHRARCAAVRLYEIVIGDRYGFRSVLLRFGDRRPFRSVSRARSLHESAMCHTASATKYNANSEASARAAILRDRLRPRCTRNQPVLSDELPREQLMVASDVFAANRLCVKGIRLGVELVTLPEHLIAAPLDCD